MQRARAWILALVVAGCRDAGDAAAHDETGGADPDTFADGEHGSEESGEPSCTQELGPVHMRRLTAFEYRGSAAVLFGADAPDVTTDFPADPIVGGFDNNAESLVLDDLLVERWRDAAEALAAFAIADAPRREALLGCSPIGAARDTCLSSFVRAFGRVAWRHALDDDEVAGLLAVAAGAADDEDPWRAVALVIEATLQSPSFLFRVEQGEVDADDPSRVRLRGAEVATRMSLLLVGATPSAALLDRADAGELDDADGVESIARELLADPRAVTALRNFHRQWLQLPVLEHVTRDTAVYPRWSPTLAAAMRDSTLALVDAFAWDPATDFRDVLVADFGFVDPELAALYGVTATSGRVDWSPTDRRGGLLTEASILTLTGKNESGLPIFRGKFVREVLLCEALPPPPADVPAIPEPQAGESDRERLERHRSDPACNGCHALLDPLGFGLAEYDAIGARRDSDSSGAPIDSRGALDAAGTQTFDGPHELAALLRDDPRTTACIVGQLHRYATGRRETDADACTLDALQQTFDDGGSLVELVIAIVRSDAFRHRPLEEGT